MAYRSSKRPQRLPGMPIQVSLLTVLVGFAGSIPLCVAQTADALSPFSPTLLQLVPWLTGVVLLAAPVAWMGRLQRRSLLGSQHTLQSLRTLPWRDFHRLVADGFRRQGYAVKLSTSGAHSAFDIVLSKAGRKILVRCARGDAEIGLEAVQQLYAAMDVEGATGVLMVTSGSISAEAGAFATDKPIALIEGPALLALVMRSRVRRAGSSSEVLVRREPYLGTLHDCPSCGGPMIEAEASAAETETWICPAPRCAEARAA